MQGIDRLLQQHPLVQLLAFLPLILLVAALWHFHINIPYMDHWDFIDTL